MTDFQIGILSLIKSAITGEKAVIGQNFDWDKALQLADKHKVLLLVYYGLYHTGITLPPEKQEHFKDMVCNLVMIDQRQHAALEKLTTCFNENHISHMPLKGSVLKSIYPKSEMRRMGDLDILVDMEQADEIRSLMQSLGFEEQYDELHEWAWKKKKVKVELHKQLVDPENRLFAQYYQTAWQRALPTSQEKPYTFRLSDEDFFVHLFTHFAKHFYIKGIGLQHAVDLWVYERAKPNLDHEYILAEFEKLHLATFYKRVRETLQVWFEGKEPTEASELISQKIFCDGVYGKSENFMMYEAFHKTGQDSGSHGDHVRLRAYWVLLFPNFTEMKIRYPILGKAPFLLPVFWVARPFQILFTKKDVLEYRKNYAKNLTAENVASRQKMIDLLGLEFESEE